MRQRVSAVALLVRDYDEALAYYVGVLGFALVEDSPRGPGKRWVVVRPPGDDTNTGFVLARAATPEQLARVGDQAAGRVAFFLQTDDFWRDYHAYVARGVRFAEPPRRETYATVAVFADCYGNRWDLLGPPT
ncbi:MAG TPA: VOC family protein [Tepidisphaeraceae bacterium]|jgi:catechol 2,3-dioxygenase-like lactoylglutathione lyase family enzyme